MACIGFIIGASLIPIEAAIPPTPAFRMITVDGDNVTAHIYDDTLNFIEGGGITITPNYDNDSLTFTATGNVTEVTTWTEEHYSGDNTLHMGSGVIEFNDDPSATISYSPNSPKGFELSQKLRLESSGAKSIQFARTGNLNDGDLIGSFFFRAEDSGSLETHYAEFKAYMVDDDGTEEGSLEFNVITNGVGGVPYFHLNKLGSGEFEILRTVDTNLNPTKQFVLESFTDGSRPTSATAGRVIFNTSDGMINIDTGSNWTFPNGTIT